MLALVGAFACAKPSDRAAWGLASNAGASASNPGVSALTTTTSGSSTAATTSASLSGESSAGPSLSAGPNGHSTDAGANGGALGTGTAQPDSGHDGLFDNGSSSANSAAARTLFWLDVSGKLLRSDAQRFALKTLTTATGKGPDGIAVDPVAGFIYWTDMGVPADDDGSLLRSKLDGSDVQTIIATADTYTPKQLKLDASHQWLYWSDREGMRVQRAKVDGSALETLYTAGTGANARKDLANHCVGIALDERSGYFYWSQKGPSNGHVGSLRRAHLLMPASETSETRSDVEILYDGLPEPIDIDLDVDQGLIYWTDRGDNSVNRGPIAVPAGFTAKTRTDREIIVSKVPDAIGIALDLPQGFVYYTDASGDLGRAKLDGSQSQFLLTKSGAFTGISVVVLPE